MLRVVNIVENNIIVNRIVVDDNTDFSIIGNYIEDPADSNYGIGYVYDETTNSYIDPNPPVDQVVEQDVNSELEEIINNL